MGDLHSEISEAYQINEIIKRLRIWLSGKIPKDSREVELFYHFTDRCAGLQYLLPDLFFDTDIVQGQYYAGLSRLIPANFLPDNSAKKTYTGVMIFGETATGLTLPPKIYIKKQRILFAEVPDIEKLILQKDSPEKSKAIDEEKLIEGYWWDISEEPEPFSDIETLAKYIGSGNVDNGFDELIKSLSDSLVGAHERIHIGLRFPGRWRTKDWQMFRLNKGARPPIVVVNRDELRDRLADYSLEAVYQEYFTDDDFHRRNKGRAKRDILKDITLSVIGCGALGSETADGLNKAGIGKIILVDKEDMRAQNVMRHCLGIESISVPKVFGMFMSLSLHNPFVEHEIAKDLKMNILQNKLKDYLPNNAIGVSTIADDNVEAYLNEQAVNEMQTVFYCRALRGGKVARIFRVIPQKDACKTCLSLYSKEDKLPFINIEEDKDLPVITNECNNPIRPASAADLKIIAGIFARIVIDFLQGTNNDKNHWIWSTESLKGIKLENSSNGFIHSAHIPPHPNCVTCQQLEAKKIHIDKVIYDFMKRESSDSNDIETGGVLMGYRTLDGAYIIQRASGPGPNAVRTKTRFEKDEEYCQKELEHALKELGDKGLYLGEWHYHPEGSVEPSGLDIKSLTEIATQGSYRIDKPVMIIFSPSLECAITIHDKNARCVRLPLEVSA